MCRLNTNEPVEQLNPMISPNFEFPVYEAEEEENEEIPTRSLGYMNKKGGTFSLTGKH